MADNDKPNPAPRPATPPNRPEPPLKADPLAAPRDPAAAVADPANPARTNPGPGANDRNRPAFRPGNTGNPPAVGTRNMPNQPVIPAPSEHVFPGPVGRPDPSRSAEERQATADAAIQAHNMKPGHLTTGEGLVTVERTSDGKPDESTAPRPAE